MGVGRNFKTTQISIVNIGYNRHSRCFDKGISRVIKIVVRGTFNSNSHMVGKFKNTLCPPCLGEALTRDTSYRGRFSCFGYEPNRFMSGSPEPEKPLKKSTPSLHTFLSQHDPF
jgi:hypothetical protein